MSPSDIGRIQPIASGPKITRDVGDKQAPPPAKAASIHRDTATVRVEIGESPDPYSAPVEQNRVELIRKALQQGTYPIVPTQIADAMIAAPMLLGNGR